MSSDGMVILRGPDEAIAAEAKQHGYKVMVSKAPAEVEFEQALVVEPGTAVPWELVKHGLHFVRHWDAACPMWRYSVLAETFGTPEERKQTKKLTLDLRIPTYTWELLFVGTSAPKGVEARGRALLEAFDAERTEGGEARLAFLRAVARVKPRLCTLPAEWMGVARKRRQPYSRHGSAVGVSPRMVKGSAPSGLVRVEVGPGRFVQCRPENVERVKADYARRERRQG